MMIIQDVLRKMKKKTEKLICAPISFFDCFSWKIESQVSIMNVKMLNINMFMLYVYVCVLN